MGKNSDFNQILGDPCLSIYWSAWWLSKSFNLPKNSFHFLFFVISAFEVSSSEAAETPCLTSVRLPQGFPLLLILLTRPMFTAKAGGTSFAIKVWQISTTNVVVTHIKWREFEIARNVVFLPPVVQFSLWCIKMQTEWCGHKNRCINHIEPQKILLKPSGDHEIDKYINIYLWSSWSNWDKNCKTGMAGIGCQAMVVVRGKALLVRLDQPGVGATTFERLGNNQNQSIL